MNRFEAIMSWMLPWECVFAKGHYGDMNYVIVEDDNSDPGGRTKFGIDHRSHPNVNLDTLTLDGAKAIYLREYWQKYGCENYPYPMGEVIYNCSVNAGYGRVQKILATGAKNASEFLDEQANFYRRLADARPKSRKFLQGWLNRVNSLRKFLKI